MKKWFINLVQPISDWYWNRRGRKAADTILKFDLWMMKRKIPRYQRRQFWRSFTKDKNIRMEIIKHLKEE